MMFSKECVMDSINRNGLVIIIKSRKKRYSNSKKNIERYREREYYLIKEHATKNKRTSNRPYNPSKQREEKEARIAQLEKEEEAIIKKLIEHQKQYLLWLQKKMK